MDTVKNATNAATDKVKEVTNMASKEGNKEQAKDSSNTLGDRASAGASAIKDGAKEQGNSMSSSANKEAAKH